MDFRGLVSRGLAAAGIASIAVAAHASGLDGTTVGLTGYYPTMTTVFSDAGTAVVGPGVEFDQNALAGYPLSFDLSSNQIVITSYVDSSFAVSSFNGFGFTFSTVIPNGASVDASSGFDPVAISFVGNELYLNYQGDPVSTGETSVIDLTFGTGVPEPASWSLMVGGFGVLGALARRGRRIASAA
jgi:hypothetical protein